MKVIKRGLFIFFLVLAFVFKGSAQTIQAPDLQCVLDSASNSNITLYWTNPAPNPCGAFVQYTIYASSTGPGGPYNPIAVTSQAATSFSLPGYLGISPEWHFYMEASYNCPGATVLQSDTVSNRPPAVPVIVNVDVTPGADVIFNWEPGASPQTHFYIIYYYLPNSGLAVPLDTVYGRFNTTYTDIKGDPTIQSLYYTIAAADSCGKISSYSTLPHKTLYLQDSVFNCRRQVDLSWNSYINWPQGVKEYQVWVSRNDSAFKMDGAVSDSTYSFFNFNDGDSICLFVRGISVADSSIVSNSNVLCFKASIVQPPAYNYITNITVEEDNSIVVTWNIDTLAELTEYQVFKSNNGVGFIQGDRYDVPAPLRSFETYKDSSGVTPQSTPYYYKIAAYDLCNANYFSTVGVTINLKGELYDYYTANLNWNSFNLFGANVLRYNLYRDYGGGYTLINSFANTTATGVDTLFNYVDSLQDFLQEKGVFCYRIEAVYDISLPTGYSASLSSWSNVQCIIHRPIIYIPNAFAPNGVNNIFKPTIIYGNPQGYTMTIFNRWGGEVFHSNDPNLGWNGTDRNEGKESPQGGYAYFIQFKAEDGVVVERQGVVLLVR